MRTIISDSIFANYDTDDYNIFTHPGLTLDEFCRNTYVLYTDIKEPIFCFGTNDLNNGYMLYEVLNNYRKLIDLFPNCILISPPLGNIGSSMTLELPVDIIHFTEYNTVDGLHPTKETLDNFIDELTRYLVVLELSNDSTNHFRNGCILTNIT